MKKENENQSLLGKLFGPKKSPKNSCCCNYEIEEITDNQAADKQDQNKHQEKNNCCKG